MNFERRDTHTIMDGMVHRYGGGIARGSVRELFSGTMRTDWSGEISASRNGVLVSGAWPVLKRREDVDAFAAQLAQAWADHVELKACDGRPACPQPAQAAVQP